MVPTPSNVLRYPIQLKRNSPTAILPTQGTPGAAGWDLYADNEDQIFLSPGERVLVPTGWDIAIPEWFEGQVRPRSGLALKKGITVLNAPGTIDADYRGPLGVILYNAGKGIFVVQQGDRIAQLVITEVPPVKFVEVEALDDTERGSGGFGSTGH